VSSRALVDSGANGFVFIDRQCAVDIAQFLNLKAYRLPRSVPVKGYNGEGTQPVTHYLRLHLTIDQRRQYNLPLLILDLGSHDLILGRKWLAFFDILVNARRACLHWPKELEPSYSVVKEIKIPRSTLTSKTTLPQRTHQEDADARDRAMDLEDQSLALITPRTVPVVQEVIQTATDSGVVPSLASPSKLLDLAYSPLPPFSRKEPKRRLQSQRSDKIDRREGLQKMNAMLNDDWHPSQGPYVRKPYSAPRSSYGVEIASIGAYAFNTVAHQPESELFTTSLYEIDRILDDRRTQGKEQA
jgi:predicted aspartyl protease